MSRQVFNLRSCGAAIKIVSLSTLNDSNPHLCDLITQQIAHSPQQRITFADFMNLVLYHPLHGYYTSRRSRIGPQGDFFTAPHLGTDFGELLAIQFAEMWAILGKPNPWILVEMGAGQGLLAIDILQALQQYHPDCWRALQYQIVEPSPVLRSEQQQRLSQFPALQAQVHWQPSLQDMASTAIVGCCFSNELVDALPVHQIVVEGGQLREVHVTAQQTDQGVVFGEISAPLSTPRLQDYLTQLNIDLCAPPYGEGYRSEVNLAALDWLETVTKRLRRGYLLTIDYGYPAQRYYSPSRQQGTLQCYYRHQYHNNPYIHLGQQDLTAHVNWTALEQWGDRCGLEKIGFTQQGLFLMALGLGDRIAAVSSMSVSEHQTLSAILRRREALQLLINPMGMGNFGVLIQAKGLTPEEKASSLQGLSVPPMA